MKSCTLNPDHMHYKADINLMDTLKRIVMRLPPHLPAKWAKESNKLIEAEREPEFSHLADFVKRRTTVANTAFGRLVGSRSEANTKPKFWRRPGGEPPASATSLGIQSANGLRAPDCVSLGQSALNPVAQGSGKQGTPPSCLFCKDRHSLERCFKFRDNTFDERKEFVSTRKLCANCLRVNHFAR